MDDLLTLHRAALGDLDRLASTLEPGDLDRRTPCADWRVADLLAHSIGQHRGFAAAVRDGDASAEAYGWVRWDPAEWQSCVADLLDAFAAADLTGTARQVELRPDEAIPVRFIVGAQLLDSAVHAWDLARALGRDYEPSRAIVTSVLGIAERIPDGPNREISGAAFGHALPSGRTPSGAAGDDWVRVLRLLGREPGWTPAGEPSGLA